MKALFAIFGFLTAVSAALVRENTSSTHTRPQQAGFGLIDPEYDGVSKRESDDENSGLSETVVSYLLEKPDPPEQPKTIPPFSVSNAQKKPGDELQFQDYDFKQLRDFKSSLHVFFPALLLHANDFQDDRFGNSKQRFEAEMLRLGEDYAKMTYSGNLFRSAASRPFHIARSLFSLLQYRHSLRHRYSGSNGQFAIDRPYGVYALKLVDLELYLFNCFSPDIVLDTGSKYAATIVEATSRFEALTKEFHETVPANAVLFYVLSRENDRIRAKLQNLRKKMTTQRKETSTNIAKIDMPIGVDEARVYENAAAAPQPVLDKLASAFGSIIQALADCFTNLEIDVDKYNVAKEAIRKVAGLLGQPGYPDEAKLRVHNFLADISAETKHMDELVSRAGEGAKSLGRQSETARDVYFQEVALLERQAETLFRSVMENKALKQGFDMAAPRSAVDRQKLRISVIQNSIGSPRWAGVPGLPELQQKVAKVASKIDGLSGFLQRVGMEQARKNETEQGLAGPEPSAPDYEALYSEIIVEPIDVQLDEIEKSLQALFKPTDWSVEQITRQLQRHKAHFEDIIRGAHVGRIPLTSSRKHTVSNITQLLVSLEEVFQP